MPYKPPSSATASDIRWRKTTNMQCGRRYHNQYWPAQYIIDKSGKIVFEHAGEGQYQEIERKIHELLNVDS